MGFIGILFLFSLLPLSILSDKNVEDFFDSVPFYHRYVRQTAGSTPVISGEECVTKCFDLMTQAVKKNLPTFDTDKKSSDPFEFFKDSVSSYFDTFCTKIYQPVSACTKNCPRDRKGSMMDIILKSFSFFEYVCITNYKNVKDNLPCLQKVFNQSKSDCKSEYDYFTITEAKNDKAQNLPDDKKTIILEEDCKATAGIVACTKKVTSKLCNADTVTIVQDVNRLAVDTLESILKLGNVTLPVSCKQLGMDAGTVTNAPGVETTTKSASSIAMSSIVFALAIIAGFLFR